MCAIRSRHGKFAILIFFAFVTQHALAAQVDLTELPLEQLLLVEVTSASKHLQHAGEAPSAVQIITREDIQLHGWRTLTEALINLPGLYASNDRAYDFLGARGFLIPGDYNTRFLLLIDGQRNNDNIYQQAVIGTEGWLDMSMVERIEYIPGPGSVIYGSNAMFGVINVITRDTGNIAQNQVGAHVSQLGETGVNVLARQTIDETGLVLQYSAEHQAGRDRTYPDPLGQFIRADGTVSPDGVAHGLDSGNNRHVMMRVDHNEWSFKLINHQRTINPSSAPYLTVFDDPSIKLDDGGTQFIASVNHELSSGSSVFARLGYTDWHYLATYPYFDLPPPDGSGVGYYQNYDDVRGQTLDGEFRYQFEIGIHHLLSGLEFSRDLLAKQSNYYSIDPASIGVVDVNINPLVQRNSLFIQDELRISQAWLVNLGLRVDTATSSDSSRSPRIALIWQPNTAVSLKLISGRAFRSANAYESQFGDGLNYLSNPGLQRETITTTEGVMEWLGSNKTRWQFSLYENRINNLIQQVYDPIGGVYQFQNRGWVQAQGLELGFEKITSADLKLRASVSTSHVQNALGTTQSNSPNWMGKASVIAPVFKYSAYLAAEAQATGSHSYSWNDMPYRVATEVVVNATATFSNVIARGIQAQLRVTNLFNRDVQHPASNEMLSPTIPQNSRNLAAKLEYAF
ncbi:MAG: TonB-dependent receptor plug domain-containing protein [Pseudomonadota bacterium]